MIDTHLHVLPGIGDGARNLTMSREMLRQMAGMGFTHLVATPHLMEPLSAGYAERVTAALAETRTVAAEYAIQLDQGYEHMLTPGLAGRLEAGERSTLAGSWAVLVEWPFGGWPQHVESSLFAQQIAGYVPVLAHPERYVDVQKEPELAVAGRGVVLQLTVASFAGVHGKAAQQSARVLLEEGLARGADGAGDRRALGRPTVDRGPGGTGMDPATCRILRSRWPGCGALDDRGDASGVACKRGDPGTARRRMCTRRSEASVVSRNRLRSPPEGGESGK